MPPKKVASSSTPKLPLPTEILSLVFTYLLHDDRSSLAQCCRVSHAMFSIAAPILYQHVYVSSIPAIDSRSDHPPDRFTATGKEKTSTRKKKLLKNAQVVTIDFHHATWCGNKSFKYPKLDTLVLRLCINGLGPVLHAFDILEKQCSLAKCLEPRKLVLENACFPNTSSDMLGVPFKLFEKAEQITFIATLTTIQPGGGAGGFPKDQSKLKKVVWIFLTPNPATKWTPGTQGVMGRNNRSVDFDMMTFAHVVRSFDDVPFYIVNAGGIDHNYVGLKEWNETLVQEKFASTLKTMIIQGGFRRPYYLGQSEPNQDQEQEDIRKEQEEEQVSMKIWENVKMLTMKEYLQNHNWTGEFECEEAKLWLA
ncbi:hypothetical protein I302_100427 [Kwoniella bestiolae CBS 10118]|uniref:F-box domain-containing protein n=1 Tax=Kwoniella bestiolae CBS 10118 TaxID=1296100 RepID=A0A1B9G531_9TREE|nr:hypothetical protein I302_03803 [Kwoniella bestiolae CBS 10118]OCF26126.1 hypothetical protein I302_03803 [Kwoniella bestiolae CBS 10118]